MPTVDAATFRQEFARYQDAAQAEPVTVTSDGRIVGGFLSSRDLDHYERLKLRERRVHVAGDIPVDILEAIEKAEYLKPMP